MTCSRGPLLLLGFISMTSVLVSLVAAPGVDGVFGAILAALMIGIAAIDADRYIIPDELTASAVILALLRVSLPALDGDWLAGLSAAARAAAITVPFWLLMIGYRYWRGRDGIGLGDVKLVAVAGVWLGWTTIFIVIELAALCALGAYVFAAAVRQRPLRATAFLPFGLFLAPAIWIGWLVEAMSN
jgi:leader peptidase (prepilin peptidase) / N-methyltransferase